MAHEELNHIDPAELSDLLAGHTSEVRQRQIRRHLETCGLCQAELALAESFHDQAADTPPAPEIEARLEARHDAAVRRAFGRRIPFPRSTWVRTGLLAASVACALLGIHTLRQPSLRPGESGTMRTAQPTAAWDLQLGEPAAGRFEIAWPSLEGVELYEIRLQSAAGRTLWSRRVDTSPLDLTLAELPAAVRAEHFLFVSVVALMADSTRQATQPLPLPVRP